MPDTLQSPSLTSLNATFFDRDPQELAIALLGKILQVKSGDIWLRARIIETEAYYLSEKASHSALGFTEKRQALFASPGTIYMYYSRGGDSLNFSARGEGNAVLIKSSYPVASNNAKTDSLKIMQSNNPKADGSWRDPQKLCAGQTLTCKSLGLKVPEWNNKQLTPSRFILGHDGYLPTEIIQTTRLGINPLRDAHLPFRFIDAKFKSYCTKDPTRVRNWQMGKQYSILTP